MAQAADVIGAGLRARTECSDAEVDDFVDETQGMWFPNLCQPCDKLFDGSMKRKDGLDASIFIFHDSRRCAWISSMNVHAAIC